MGPAAPGRRRRVPAGPRGDRRLELFLDDRQPPRRRGARVLAQGRGGTGPRPLLRRPLHLGLPLPLRARLREPEHHAFGRAGDRRHGPQAARRAAGLAARSRHRRGRGAGARDERPGPARRRPAAGRRLGPAAGLAPDAARPAHRRRRRLGRVLAAPRPGGRRRDRAGERLRAARRPHRAAPARRGRAGAERHGPRHVREEPLRRLSRHEADRAGRRLGARQRRGRDARTSSPTPATSCSAGRRPAALCRSTRSRRSRTRRG